MTSPLPFEDPLRRCLKLSDWPEQDRLAWDAAFVAGDILDGTVGPAYHWSIDTREKYRKGYGRWLTFLITSGRLERQAAPSDRVTPDAVSAYADELKTQVESWTVWGRLAELLAVCKAIAPDSDWSWLRVVVRKLEARTAASRNKHIKLRPAHEILARATQAMDDIIVNPPLRHPLTRYRDALMIALLISCPTMRLKNLTLIEIGQHLVQNSTGVELRFAGPEMKARKPVEIPVPDLLTAYLTHYRDDIRHALLAKAPKGPRQTPRLWITQYGEPMTEKSTYSAIVSATKRAFGHAINPHLFRDCAVTSVALDDPKHIGIAAPILGHTDLRTTEAHYIQAQQISAGRKLQASLRTLRNELTPRRRTS